LEFMILTAVRTIEVRRAEWDEISGNTWRIPAQKMKSGREFEVPLCDRAMEIIEEMRAARTDERVFPIARTSLLTVLKNLGAEVTAHGFRSSFRDFAGARTMFPREIAELCLAHRIGDATEQAYARRDYIERRRKLMDAWASFCTSPPAIFGEIVALHSAR
jgi:integrase